MEIWTSGTTSTHPGVYFLNLNKFPASQNNSTGFDTFSYCRQHILLAMVFEDVTKGLTCFW